MREYNFDEEKYLADFKAWIDSTYGEDYHYAGKTDTTKFMMENMETLEFFKGNVIKYILRYGRKEGSNDKDLYKAVHYIIMMLYFNDERKKKITVYDGTTTSTYQITVGVDEIAADIARVWQEFNVTPTSEYISQENREKIKKSFKEFLQQKDAQVKMSDAVWDRIRDPGVGEYRG